MKPLFLITFFVGFALTAQAQKIDDAQLDERYRCLSNLKKDLSSRRGAEVAKGAVFAQVSSSATEVVYRVLTAPTDFQGIKVMYPTTMKYDAQTCQLNQSLSGSDEHFFIKLINN